MDDWRSQDSQATMVMTQVPGSQDIRRRRGVCNMERVGGDLGVVKEPRLGQHHHGPMRLGPEESRGKLGGRQSTAVEVDVVEVRGRRVHSQESIRAVRR
jgi:hypothetical protein